MENEKINILHGDCLAIMPTLEAESFDACVCDPPYHLTANKKGGTGPASLNINSPAGRARISTGFMGRAWDGGDVAFRVETWAEVFRVLKPGAHLLAFGGTRTYHRMVCAIEDAGFEIRDTVCWHYGTGFPKSQNVSKALDKAAGKEREVISERYTVKRIKPGATVVNEGAWGKQEISYTATDTAPATAEAAQWDGWGSALKPATELICLARKPLSEGTIAANVLRHGTGAINVDACRVSFDDEDLTHAKESAGQGQGRETANEGGAAFWKGMGGIVAAPHALDRWPANLCHDGSPEILEAFAAFGVSKTAGTYTRSARAEGEWLHAKEAGTTQLGFGDTGTAARFFYSAKASAQDRINSKHATVKPVSLMRWLCRLVTPPNGLILDPFAGSGTTGHAALLEGFRATLIELEAQSYEDCKHRLTHVRGEDTPLFKAPKSEPPPDLFSCPAGSHND